MQATPTTLQVSYFDGKSAQAQSADIRVEQSVLHIHNQCVTRTVPVAQVQWPERTRHGHRMALLPAGGVLRSADGPAWDLWCKTNGLQEPSIVVLQQSWRWVGASALTFALLIGALHQWGLPIIAQGLVALTPYSVDEKLGQTTLEAIDGQWMEPSLLPQAQQDRIRQAFKQALDNQDPDQVPPWKLEFRKSRIGANALALPGGTILMTDDLVQLVDGDTQVLTAVLAHEIGHVKHRDGLRMLVQVSALGAVSSLVLGDFSSVLATMPALLGQAQYSRAAEHEADAHAVQVLTAAGIPPKVMVTLFEKLQGQRQEALKKGANGENDSEKRAEEVVDLIGIAFASHPPDAERVALFKGSNP